MIQQKEIAASNSERAYLVEQNKSSKPTKEGAHGAEKVIHNRRTQNKWEQVAHGLRYALTARRFRRRGCKPLGGGTHLGGLSNATITVLVRPLTWRNFPRNVGNPMV
jgi:hypothetical protein